MLNSIILMGRLTRDPELRKTGDDKSVANFTLAFDNIRVNQDGERDSSFIDVRCFGATAESVCKNLRKGSKCAITGTIEQRHFMRQDGSKGSKFEVNADSVEFLDPKPVNAQQEAELAEVDVLDEDGALDSCGSLDGEKYVDENGQEQELKAVPPEPKFDPFTGKPLKPAKKK